jgi:hypothetical protein
MLFCLLATSGFLTMEFYAAFAPAAAEIRLERLRLLIDTHRDPLIVLIALLIGFWLAGQSIALLVG